MRGERSKKTPLRRYTAHKLQPSGCLSSKSKRREPELRWIYDCVFNPLAFPGVGDVDQPIASLDDSRIRELFVGFVFQDERGFPVLAIFRNGDVQRAAAFGAVI